MTIDTPTAAISAAGMTTFNFTGDISDPPFEMRARQATGSGTATSLVPEPTRGWRRADLIGKSHRDDTVGRTRRDDGRCESMLADAGGQRVVELLDEDTLARTVDEVGLLIRAP